MEEHTSKRKVLLFLFNLILFFAGFAVIALGFYIVFYLKDYTNFISTDQTFEHVVAEGYALIGIGTLMTVVYFLGCCGACSDNKCMLYSFSVMMALVLVAQIGMSISFFVVKGEIETAITKVMRERLEKYSKPKFEHFTKGWDKMQTKF